MYFRTLFRTFESTKVLSYEIKFGSTTTLQYTYIQLQLQLYESTTKVLSKYENSYESTKVRKYESTKYESTIYACMIALASIIGSTHVYFIKLTSHARVAHIVYVHVRVHVHVQCSTKQATNIINHFKTHTT